MDEKVGTLNMTSSTQTPAQLEVDNKEDAPFLKPPASAAYVQRKYPFVLLASLQAVLLVAYFLNMDYVHKHLICKRLQGSRSSIPHAKLLSWSRQTYNAVIPSFENTRFFYNMSHENLGRHECCPSQAGGLFYALSADPIGSPSRHDPEGVYVYFPPPHTAYANDTWIEVTRCTNAKIKSWEYLGAWYYAMPGSGIFLNTGKTIVVPISLVRDANSPAYDFRNSMFDTVQILDNPDQRCGNMAVEIVSVRASGQQLCADEYRSGYNASQPCRCVGVGQCIACSKT